VPLACEEPQYCGSQAAAVLSTVKLEETTFLPTSIHMLATKYSKNFAMVRLHDRRNVYVDTSHGAHADFDCGSAFCATHLHLVCPFFFARSGAYSQAEEVVGVARSDSRRCTFKARHGAG